MKVSAKDKADALDTLRRCYPEGATVYTILESVSRSGMQARIRVLAHNAKQGFFCHPNWATSRATGLALVSNGARDSVKVNGCGFDRAESVKGAIERALGYKAGALNHEAL